MNSVRGSSPPVNSMTEQAVDVAARLKRDVAFHRAAQVLADAIACRAGEAPRNLSTMPPLEREWFKQTARQAIETFETLTADREPDAVVEQRTREAAKQATARESRISMDRSRARVSAMERGHDLGPWSPSVTGEMASCVRCSRTVFINLALEPAAIAGPGVTEGCLTAAGREEL